MTAETAIQTRLYKDTITPLNSKWNGLCRAYGLSDTRVSYLKQFELALSQNCPNMMLWQMDIYKDLEKRCPLSEDDPRQKVPPGTFWAYMLVYEQIMRAIGLIDKVEVSEEMEAEEDENKVKMYDLNKDDDDLDEFFAHTAAPGMTWLTSGFKGGGKSHTAIAVAEKLVKGAYPSVKNVVVATNIIFFHRVGDEIREETPENVYHIETMKELFPIVVKAMEKYGREKTTILLILDEAQNFIGGDSNATNASVMMKEFLGIIRKFRMIVWFLTPSAQSIGPSFRNFLNDEKYPGNLTAKWKKDLALNSRYIRENRLPYKEKELMLVKNFDLDPVFLRIPITEWTKTKETLEDGEYCYDHEASATFYVGDNFDWELFNRKIGGVSSINAIQKIKDFYGGIDCEPDDPKSRAQKEEEEKRRNMALFSETLKENGMDFETIAKSFNISSKTLREWRKKYLIGKKTEIGTE